MNLKILSILAALGTDAPALISDVEDLVKALEGNAPLQQKLQNVLAGFDKLAMALLKDF